MVQMLLAGAERGLVWELLLFFRNPLAAECEGVSQFKLISC